MDFPDANYDEQNKKCCKNKGLEYRNSEEIEKRKSEKEEVRKQKEELAAQKRKIREEREEIFVRKLIAKRISTAIEYRKSRENSEKRKSRFTAKTR